MSGILNKPYELSVWNDFYDNGALVEQKTTTIGSSVMDSPFKALEPVLVSKINGTHTLTFTMHSRMWDNDSKGFVENPFVKYLTNEAKLKLHYDDEWLDFVIKNISATQEKYTFKYTAQDLFINELSKAGYHLDFNTDSENNTGSIIELAQQVVAGTQWTIDTENSDNVFQTNEEALFLATLSHDITVRPLVMDGTGRFVPQESVSLARGTQIYLFYSTCASQDNKVQFIWMNGATPQKDSKRIITNGLQCYIDIEGTNWGYEEDAVYGIYYPSFCAAGMTLTPDYRGAKYVFSQDAAIHPLIKQLCYKYEDPLHNEYWGYTETTYPAPNIIENFISNHTSFQSTSGWTGGYLASPLYTQTSRPTIELSANPTIQSVITNSLPIMDYYYNPVLAFDWGTASTGCTPVIINEGFNSQKSKLKSLAVGDKFVCCCMFYRNESADSAIGLPTGFVVRVGDSTHDVDGVATGRYEPLTNANTYLTFDNWAVLPDSDYFYCVAEVSSLAVPQSEEYWTSNNSHINTFLTASAQTARLIDLQIFRFCDDGNGYPLWPESQTVEIIPQTIYHYFADGDYDSKESIIFINSENEPLADLTPVYRANCEKIRSITASKSNRFNILQQLCETFECWASFTIEHDITGHIVNGGCKITFHNYIGQENPIDFVYGIDVKSIQRTLDSNAIVTKLIVEPNSNEYAPGGFCSIQDAYANPTGETTIYNFDYYIRQGMLDPVELENDLYTDDDPYLGYYVNLKRFNNRLQAIQKEYEAYLVPKMQADADVQAYQAAFDGASEQIDTNSATLQRNWGRTFMEIAQIDPSHFVSDDEREFYARFGGTDPTDEKLRDLVVETVQLAASAEDYYYKLEAARDQQEAYNDAIQALEDEAADLIEQKAELNAQFYNKYSRFIQEGTWIDEKYTDKELYFYDAQSVGYESAIPKVTYTINVLDVCGLEGLENREFRLGDRTKIEDPEFFGYETIILNSPIAGSTYTYTIRNPIREDIVITELSKSLDQPEKNTIKVQTYKSEFEALFQRITATVQQVHYATGSYERAAELAEADVGQKVAFLQDALNDASVVLTNLAEQTVTWDKTGITITDSVDTSQKLRIVSGGLLMTTDGGSTWASAVTARGISASKITSGQLDTALIQIMNGSEAYFRWDAFGLTAFKFDYTQSGNNYLLDGLDTLTGVRFDRFGIYGFNNIDGQTWHPTSIANWDASGALIPNDRSIYSQAIFALTWDGLYLNLGEAVYKHYKNSGGTGALLPVPIAHSTNASIGKTDDYIYNAWNGDTPYYDSTSSAATFVRVFHTVNPNNSAQHVDIYDDGTIVAGGVKLSGHISASTGTIGGFTIGTTTLSSSAGGYIALSSGGDYAIWAGNSTAASAPFSVTHAGVLKAESGTIGGFTITSDKLANGSGTTYVALQSGNTYALWAGNTSASSAPFYVTRAGAIRARSGEIGGFTLTSDTLANGSGSNYIALQSGGTYALWAGNSSAASAPFSVTRAGAIKATSGNIGGMDLDSNGLHFNIPNHGILDLTVNYPSDTIDILMESYSNQNYDASFELRNTSGSTVANLDHFHLMQCTVTTYRNGSLVTKTLEEWLQLIP